MGCRWSWRLFRCVAPLPPPTSTLNTITATLQSLTAAGNRLTLITAIAIVLHALVIAILLSFALRQHCQRTRPGLARTIYRLIVCRGRRLPGVLTKLVFPIHAAELTPERLTAMLRHGGHLDGRTSVVAVRDRLQRVRDGVKGDKAIIDVEYGSVGGYAVMPAGLPSTLFVKFSLQVRVRVRKMAGASSESEQYGITARVRVRVRGRAYRVAEQLTGAVEGASAECRPLLHLAIAHPLQAPAGHFSHCQRHLCLLHGRLLVAAAA